MGEASAASRARCVQRAIGQVIQRAAEERPAISRYLGWCFYLKWPLVIGALVASLICLTCAWADDCLSSADAVRQQHPEAWPSWTLRAPDHEGSKCWYAGKRSTHQSQRTAETKSSPRPTPRTISDPPLATKPLSPNSLASGPDAATLRVATVATTEAISDQNDKSAAPAPTASNAVPSVTVDKLEQRAVRPPEVALAQQNSLRPERKTNQASFMTTVFLIFGVALVFASVLAGVVAGRRRPTGAGSQRTRYSAEGARSLPYTLPGDRD
jgi:hypothetical protein